MSDGNDLNPISEEESKNSDNNIITTFFTALLICCGLYGYAIYLHNGHIVEGQNRIICTYEQQVERLESRKHISHIWDSQREKEMETFHKEVKSLLDLEFNRIQNEFEAIEIWTGILTVIFLIFSFYSLFKTEQLENQSKDELLRIKKISDEGRQKFSTFETVSAKKLNTLESAVEKIEDEAKKQIEQQLTNGQTESLTIFDQRAKEILETYKGAIKEMLTANLKEAEKAHNVYVKRLQSIADKELLLGDADEEELDEEELRKDKEREEKEEKQ